MAERHVSSATVVGVAESGLGIAPPGTTAIDLMAQASVRALDDAGLSLKDVDGLFVATSQARFGPMVLAEYLGLSPTVFDGTQVGGSSFMSHLAHAVLAIEAGQCQVALIAYGSTQRSMSRAQASVPDFNPYEAPFKPMLPVAAYALAAGRHMHEFGTTREHLAEVAVAARQWALLNPKAWEKEPLTVQDVLSSRMVSDPLSVRDCCLVLDGGGAMVITSRARAAACRQKPVHVLGTGQALGHATIANMPDLTTTVAREAGQRAFAMAGLTPGDVDVLSLYDAFTITPILFLEDLGFCPKGEGGRFVSGGHIAPGGGLPVNTNGGGLSYCHPGMYGLLGMVETVRQIRGEAGARQVKDCHIGLAHGNGAVLSSQCTAIFGSDAVL
ncbi:MAG: thiolase [Gammaproteobacteria bacterium]|nr:thiolase [Gammaproteobacteria bacterium]MBU1443830.1 thiolase [Gammaproteobacteria bacterium]MBU2288532.1 thiolase [Gammaproteobacteria bacterium]MBU2410345.1 thiolase [Gammaproteobacteria bacterium]